MKCEYCNKEYDVENAKRVYGGLPWTDKICSAFCYTQSLEPKKETPKKFQKITVGFVIQEYQTEVDGSHTPTSQEFIAGDQVDYEDMDGEEIEVDTLKEVYCPFDMKQPMHRPFPPVNEVKAAYEDGVCPDCDTGIPDDVADGQCCSNCTHVFYYPRPDDG
jgi:hypothetical protein